MAGAVDVYPAQLPPSMSTMHAVGASSTAAALSTDPWSYTSPASYLVGFANASQSRTAQSSLTAPRQRSTHARLHKRHSSNLSSQSGLPSQLKRSTTDSIVAPLTSVRDASPTSPNPPPSKAIPRDQLRRHLRWRGKGSDQNNEGIDLSRTVAENEERCSGLGISMQSPAVDLASTGQDDLYRSASGSRAHQRSISHTSAASNASVTSFKPSAPFVHPYKQSPTIPTATPSPRISESISEHESYFPAGGSNGISNLDSDTCAPSQSAVPSRRPSLRLNTATAPRSLRIRSASYTVAGADGVAGKRSRRATDLSLESPTPTSRASLDRAFTFIRGEQEPLDPLAKAATIHAARQAFEERQEAKDRKWEKLERKAAERAERQAEKKDERARRKSECADRKRSSNVAVAGYNELQLDSESRRRRHSLPKLRSSSAPTSAKQVHFKSTETMAPTKKSAKHTAKTNYARFGLWFKTHLFHMSRNVGVGH